mmetsp:Transcript_3375/g.7774  ORF Transcript_3375/g.7774 Transcript_3375/m.7774 type:complete len:220 (+) Transcript_3375:184-843(+)
MSASAGGGVPRDRDEELEEEEDLEGEYDEEDDGNNSDSEAFMSARDNTSDWYQEMRRMGHSAESPMGTARSTEQFWTPRDVATEGPTVAECEAANTFRPNLMPKEFEKIFSKTRNGRYKEVESLMEKGAPIDAQDPFGNTVLHTACQNGNKRILKACLRRGVDTNAQNIKGHTALHYCFAYGYVELAEYLVEKGHADPTIRNNFGLTAQEGLGVKAGPS